MTCYFIGIDVGTSSVRGILVDNSGKIQSRAVISIGVYSPAQNFYEQSSDEIWQACCTVVQNLTVDVGSEHIKGIGFDATCSLVVLDKEFHPVAVNLEGNHSNNVILWMDHRAEKEAEYINGTGHEVLRYVGGKISPEMEIPKLLWLKKNLSESCWRNAAHFFDLCDYLSWRATGDLSRSLCSLVCKWTYQANEDSQDWSESFFQLIGLDDSSGDLYHKIGTVSRRPGEPCGSGLTAKAADELKLKLGIPVATSLIDAHAGGIGTILCSPVAQPQLTSIPLTSRLVIVSGTSTCHMIVKERAVFVPGVWGPYFSAMVPGLWLNEAGQSASGKLLDYITERHPAYQSLNNEAKLREKHVFMLLNDRLRSMANAKGMTSVSELTSDLHIWPDFHGNRSPLADPSLRGMICGMALSLTADDLAMEYLATVQALAYGTKHIVEALLSAGHCVQLVYICGGLRQNPLFVQTHADVLGLPTVVPEEGDTVPLGAAILGASASGQFTDIQEAMRQMSGSGRVVYPQQTDVKFHQRKYLVFLEMLQHQKLYQRIMTDALEVLP